MRKDDNALAPVIAVMLILAIGVTVYSIYMSTYLPGLKQQDEVEHLSYVEAGFVRFSTDINNAAYLKNEGVLSEQIPLGGGDILINSLKSSGTIRVNYDLSPENAYPFLIIRNGSEQYGLYLVNISYTPMGNFWINQGYTWQYGYVNVTKGGRSIPLKEETAEQTASVMNTFARTLISGPDPDGGDLTYTTVSFSRGNRDYSSGNGNAKITLNATRSPQVRFVNTTGFSFIINRTSPLNDSLFTYLNTPVPGLLINSPIINNQEIEIPVISPTPVNVTIQELTLTIETQ